MCLKYIPKFEDLNKLHINVFSIKNGNKNKNKIVPIYLSEKNYEITINLLMIEHNNSEEEEERWHNFN